MQTVEKPKEILKGEEDNHLDIGDIVVLYDESENIETFIVKQICDDKITICGISLTETKDDVYVKELETTRDKIINVGLPFININGYLYKLREYILNDKPLPINLF